MAESRTLPVPDGLDGTRVDTGIAKLLGFSRTFAAEVVDAGGVSVDGRVVGKSDKLRRDTWLEVSWSPREEPRIIPVIVPELAAIGEFGYDHGGFDRPGAPRRRAWPARDGARRPGDRAAG